MIVQGLFCIWMYRDLFVANFEYRNLGFTDFVKSANADALSIRFLHFTMYVPLICIISCYSIRLLLISEMDIIHRVARIHDICILRIEREFDVV